MLESASKLVFILLSVTACNGFRMVKRFNGETASNYSKNRCMTLLEKLWLWLTDTCECGGHFTEHNYSMPRWYCNKCGKHI